MKVLVVCSSLPTKKHPLSDGGFALQQAQALAAEGLDVVVAAVDMRSLRRLRRYGITHNVYGNIEGYSISNIPLGKVPIWMSETVGNWELWRLYKHIFRDGSKPDVIHAHFSIYAGLNAVSLARRIDRPLIITEHNSATIEFDANYPKNRAACRAWKAADRVIAVSNALARGVYELSGVNCTVIHNMLDLSPFLQVKRDNTPGFGFVTTGNLIPIKNHSMLLEAFAALHSTHSDTRLGIIGDGYLEKSLKRQAKSLGIADAVTFYGRVLHAEMSRIYNAYDCFVFPSNIETFGIALAEGMAAGMPVIATKCGGPNDFVRPEDGILTQPGNLQELTDAMRKVYRSHSQYGGNDTRAYVTENFAPSHIAQKIIKVYEDVCR